MSEKITICFVRHGKTLQNLKHLIQGRKDFPLSDVGREEAKVTANFLKEHDPHWDLICSSPLSRAHETAQIIADILGYKKEVLVKPAFIEREFGVAEGMPVCDETYVKILDDSWEGLEKTKDLGDRLVKGMNDLIQEIDKDTKKILIVSHAHAIKGVLKAVDDTRSMSDGINNCAMNYIEYEDGKYKVVRANVTPY